MSNLGLLILGAINYFVYMQTNSLFFWFFGIFFMVLGSISVLSEAN